MSSYINEIKSIDNELLRCRNRTKILTDQKNKAKLRLYEYMIQHHLDELDGIKIATITPKEKPKRKPAAQKKADAVRVLYDAGLMDAESVYDQIRNSQKHSQENIALL